MRKNNKHKTMNDNYNRANNRDMRVHNGGMGLNNEREIRVWNEL